MNEDLIRRLSQMTQKAYTEIGPAWPLIMSQLLGALTPADLESLLPDGMVIVPVEATEEMVKGGIDRLYEHAKGYPEYAPDNIHRTFAAMIAARPKLGDTK